MVSGCDGGDALFKVLLGSVKPMYTLSVCRIVRNMVVNPVLAFLKIERLTNIEWHMLKDPACIS